MSAIAKGDASPRAPGVFVGRDVVDVEPWDEAGPYVCPGCFAVGGERCAADCIELEREQREQDEEDRDPPELDEEVTCIADDCTECDCARCQGDQARWEAWQGWSSEGLGDERDEDDGEIPF